MRQRAPIDGLIGALLQACEDNPIQTQATVYYLEQDADLLVSQLQAFAECVYLDAGVAWVNSVAFACAPAEARGGGAVLAPAAVGGATEAAPDGARCTLLAPRATRADTEPCGEHAPRDPARARPALLFDDGERGRGRRPARTRAEPASPPGRAGCPLRAPARAECCGAADHQPSRTGSRLSLVTRARHHLPRDRGPVPVEDTSLHRQAGKRPEPTEAQESLHLVGCRLETNTQNVS